MATIRKRNGKRHVQVRHASHPTQTKTFLSKPDTQKWGRLIEAELDKQVLPFDPKLPEQTTAADLLTRYRDTVTPSKRGAASERKRVDVFLRQEWATVPVSKASAQVFSRFRDQRLKAAQPSTVVRPPSATLCRGGGLLRGSSAPLGAGFSDAHATDVGCADKGASDTPCGTHWLLTFFQADKLGRRHGNRPTTHKCLGRKRGMTLKLYFVTAFVTALLLAGCAQNVIEDYSGPTARFASTSMSRGARGGDYFALESVNGLTPSMRATTPTGNKRGDVFTAIFYVPAKSGRYTISGNTKFFPPIFQLMNKVYRISGDISFTPEPNKTYVVKGEMNDDHSSVWIEDSDTGAIMDKKIEISGSTAVGVLEK